MSRQLDTAGSAILKPHAARAEPRTAAWALSRAIGRMPMFWRFQIVGWTIHGALTLPLKFIFFNSFSTSLLTSAIAEPVGFLQTWAMRALYQRLGLRIERPRRLVIWAVIICSAAALSDWVIAQPIHMLIRATAVTQWVLFAMTWNHAVQYVLWTILYFGIKTGMAARLRALNLARAESDAREAELRMLRAQINPHFLFNSLNTVLAGLRQDQQELAKVVQGLADYFRYSLAHRHEAMVPLGEEFDAAMNYLLVEKARYRDDLQLETHIDRDARGIPVPGVILQPLIENAVKHGNKSSPLPLRLRLNIRIVADGDVMVEVANSGRWIEPPAHREPGDAGGVGLESLARRLALLYPGRHRFDISKTGEEVVVRIQLPAAAASPIASA